ncbi:MAG: amidohydrolase family protein [Nitrospina sp.]|nr:amidohydrolase family protein [Nitrospina sp.]MBT3510926.1 amidohydrolase family protein [Nitrospina sp.]MBT3875221.1 amidohydrolase family protein [Nitrospina sp.]MBT5350113.1 amidohydrolase family protein [Nitrospina sp.]MBT7198068.1 amidohydrolase family protein [Nitrospina sp.]
MKIKFRALLTMCGETVENGELTVDAGNIVEISTSQGNDATALDLSDCLLMPGFVNAHSHLGLTALEKKLSPAKSFADWIRALISINSGLDDESRVRGIRAGAEEMKRSGVTALGDYVAEPDLLPVMGGLEFRSVLFLETIGFHSEKALAICKNLEETLKGDPFSPLSRLGLAPHAPYSVSPNLFRSLGKLAQQYDCPLSCHVAEIPEESGFLQNGDDSLEELLKERSAWDPKWKPPGKSPIEYLNSLNILESLLAIHCNFIAADLDVMALKKVSAVFCPKSTHWFGRKDFMPVRTLLDRGIGVALGTDSLASNDSLNFLQELRMADKLLPDVSRKEILTMATLGGAEALGLQCGKLACGQKADLIGFRISPPYSGSWSDIPFESHRQEVDFYMLDGRPKTFLPSNSSN